jgi:hypothetical protein
MADDMNIPSIRPLSSDLGSFPGLKFLLDILDNDIVIITASKIIVTLLVIFGVMTSPGKIPERFVMNDSINATVIMNALLVRSFRAKRIFLSES